MLPRDYPVRLELGRDHVVQVIHNHTREVLAWCFIGDDHNVEKIADLLSSKYLGAAAMELREMARHPPPPKPSVVERLAPLLPPGLFNRLFG
jgi:hypothetical protein